MRGRGEEGRAIEYGEVRFGAAPLAAVGRLGMLRSMPRRAMRPIPCAFLFRRCTSEFVGRISSLREQESGDA